MQTITDFSSIRFTGRWHTEAIGGVSTRVCIASGNSLYFKVSGTSSISLSTIPIADASFGSMIVETSIDGGAFSRSAQIVASPTIIADGLSLAEHTVEIVIVVPYYSNAWNNHHGMQMQGIVVDDGAVISAWDRAWAGRVLWIGDSILEGEQVFSPHNATNAAKGSVQAYSRLISAATNMEYHNWSFGGSGLTRFEPFRQVPVTLSNFGYKMAGVVADDDPDFAWIVIEVSTNDRASDSSTFQSRYGALVDLCRANWPAATVYCIGTPPFAPYYAARSGDVQAVATAKGCVYIDAAGWGAYTAHLHPWESEHAAIAAAVAPMFAPPVNLPPHFVAQPVIVATTGSSISVAFETSDPEGDHHQIEISVDNGASWVVMAADSAPGSGTITIDGLAAGDYTVVIRLTALSGDASPVLSDSIDVTVSPVIRLPAAVRVKMPSGMVQTFPVFRKAEDGSLVSFQFAVAKGFPGY